MKKLILLSLVFFSCNNSNTNDADGYLGSDTKVDYEAISLLGDTLIASMPSEKLLARFNLKKESFDEDPLNIDNIIWYGRFMAYTGQYNSAIDIYTNGIDKYPDEARLYRHRGHRYISIREFDKAITDLNKASQIVEGTENQIEPDGMPNDRNIPVSTLHGNIYYHLGLAHYLNRNMPEALKAYKKCLETSNNPDNVVSATHWIYMILRRMGRLDTATNYLRNITDDMDIIENMSYHKACLLYKGELDVESISSSKSDNASNTALQYAVAHWYYYNGNPMKAKELYLQIVNQDDWASFGFIAAESDLSKLF